MNEKAIDAQSTLWKLYRRHPRPTPWINGGNLPWDDPSFSRRMLAEHLDESHGAASRKAAERQLQLEWLWLKCGLQTGSRVLDVTCGPGLYALELTKRGCLVTGIDFSPASIEYARQLANSHFLSDRCTFIQEDVRETDFTVVAPADGFDAALFLYGQLAVFPTQTAVKLLRDIRNALRPGSRLCIELLNQEKIDKEESSWWFTDDKGLWGEKPFLHLGERFWLEEEALSIERYHIIDLESGKVNEINLCDQTYSIPEMITRLHEAGFRVVDSYPAWDGLHLYDAAEWVVYIAAV